MGNLRIEGRGSRSTNMDDVLVRARLFLGPHTIEARQPQPL